MLLFVVGMHRSGTSALCAALHAGGFSFGENLLAAQAGVNDEGFWEDSDVVSLNEALLANLGGSWFSVPDAIITTDWDSAEFEEHRRAAMETLSRGFGGDRAAVKDPRFCLTLPFWLSCCAQLGIDRRVCVTARSALEVACSLEKRDGFPLGYGLRLFESYQSNLESHLPQDAARVSFEELLAAPADTVNALNLEQSEAVRQADYEAVLRPELRHHVNSTGTNILSKPITTQADLPALHSAIESDYPVRETLQEFAVVLTNRSAELTSIGEAHTRALQTLQDRDADIESLSAEHTQALATIAERDAQIAELDHRLAQAGSELEGAMATIVERDEQIAEFDRRLAKLGEEHTYALEVINERDAQIAEREAQLDRIRNIPGVGLVARRLLSNEKS